MPDMIRIKAAPGRKVRRPDTMEVLPKDGIDVDVTDVFWHRRIVAEDVVVVKPDEKSAGNRASRKSSAES
jgi:hypothetical protein